MSREAMQLALEALEDANDVARMQFSDEDYYSEAINALRQAIEQAEQQEPVAWRDMAYANLGAVRDKMPPEQVTAVQDWLEKVYTTPPQRQFVGLTDEEREFLLHQALRFYDTDAQLLSFIKSVEAKLKEKNA